MERPRIGELLVAAGVIEPDVLESALEKQQAQGGRLGRILIAMGAIDEELLVRTVARQLDMPVAWLRGKQVKAEVLAMLPAHVARRHRCLPVMIDRKGPETLLVAMEDPSDAAALDDVALAAGRPVRVVLASPSELEDALERHYPAPAVPDPQQEPEPAPAPAPAASAEARALEPPQEEGHDLESDPPHEDLAQDGLEHDDLAHGDLDGGDEEPELLLTDPLGETGSGGSEPDLHRLARDEAFAAPPAEADPLDLGGSYDPAAPELGPALETFGELAPGDDLGLDLGADAEPVRVSAEAQGDSLDDAIDEVRGAKAGEDALESDGLAQGEAGVSLFGDDPLEATMPPRPAGPEVLPRDAELRAVVLLLIERGVLSRAEVAERLLALGRDDGKGG